MVSSANSSTCEQYNKESEHTDYCEERRDPVESLTSWGVMDLPSLQAMIQKGNNGSRGD